MNATTTQSFEIIAVRYGTRQTLKSEIYFDYAVYGEPDGDAVMDYFFWIIRDGHETIVVDTGFSVASGARLGRSFAITPAAALARLGINPATVRDVILTHAHYDHTGNIALFPNARIIMSRAEFDFITGPFANRPLFTKVMDAQDNALIVHLHAEGRVTLVGQRQVFRPGIELIVLPGHSPGQIALVIQSINGPVILSSDAVHYYEEVELDRPFAIMSGMLEMFQSLAAIRQWMTAPGAVLVPGHDPEVMRRFAPLDPNDPTFAVRIV